jgi:hypothetical protein
LRQNIEALAFSPTPDADDTYDLGSATKEWRDLYLDGTANIDSLVADTADINGGTIDGVTNGTNSACIDLRVDNLKLDGNTLSTTNPNGNFIILPNGSGITIIGDAGSTSHSLAANDDLFVSGKLEVDGQSYFDNVVNLYSAVYCSSILGIYEAGYTRQSSNSGSKIERKEEYQLVTIAATASSATTTTLSVPVRSTITGIVARVVQAPGGGPTNFNVGINGGDADCIIDNAAVTVDGTFDAWEDGDGTYDFYIPVTTAGGALTFDVTTTDGADNPTAVTGASFILRLTAFYETRTPHTS